MIYPAFLSTAKTFPSPLKDSVCFSHEWQLLPTYVGFVLILALLVVLTGIAVVKVNRIADALHVNGDITQFSATPSSFRGSAHDRSIAVRVWC